MAGTRAQKAVPREIGWLGVRTQAHPIGRAKRGGEGRGGGAARGPGWLTSERATHEHQLLARVEIARVRNVCHMRAHKHSGHQPAQVEGRKLIWILPDDLARLRTRP